MNKTRFALANGNVVTDRDADIWFDVQRFTASQMVKAFLYLGTFFELRLEVGVDVGAEVKSSKISRIRTQLFTCIRGRVGPDLVQT